MWGRTCAGAGGNPSSLPWRKKEYAGCWCNRASSSRLSDKRGAAKTEQPLKFELLGFEGLFNWLLSLLALCLPLLFSHLASPNLLGGAQPCRGGVAPPPSTLAKETRERGRTAPAPTQAKQSKERERERERESRHPRQGDGARSSENVMAPCRAVKQTK